MNKEQLKFYNKISKILHNAGFDSFPEDNIDGGFYLLPQQKDLIITCNLEEGADKLIDGYIKALVDADIEVIENILHNKKDTNQVRCLIVRMNYDS